MRLLILGAGGIGGYYGGRLVEAGADVTFLVRPARRAQLESDGLQILSPQGDATLKVHACLQSEVSPDFDLVLLTCKSYDLDGALETLAPAMAGKAALLPLLNGVSHLAQLNGQFGIPRVVGGTARIAATLTPEGVVRHLNDWALIGFGEQDGQLSDRVIELKPHVDKAGVACTDVNDYGGTYEEFLEREGRDYLRK